MRDLFTSFKDNCGFGLLASINNTPSHKNLEDAITSLSRMMHRGAIAADGKSGDGSGLLLSLPKKFFTKEAKKDGIVLPNMYAVAMLFYQNEKQLDTIKEICLNNDLKVFYKREVPINTEALGVQALETLPKIAQLFVMPNSLIGTRRFEALVYLSRKEVEHTLQEDKDFYIPSFSTSVVSYKGLVMPTHIKEFYQDLANPHFEISFCLFHQRFSTNTLPQWKLAQPFRMIAHNGEINSVTANRFNVKAKSEDMKSDIFSDEELSRLENIIQGGMSDSASVDNFFEFLNVNGVDFFKAARSMFPAPWQNAPHMDADLRAFYEYTSTCFEPWDGPAAVSMTDGRYIGCVLDRNGLRPAKYIITSDNRILITSEYGVLDIPDENIIERGRLQSGEMIGLDLKYGKVLKSKDIDNYLKNREPYGQWLNENMSYLQEHLDTPFNSVYDLDEKILEAKQRYFNITHEVLDQVIEPMMKEGKEATGSMGDDTPLAAFSNKQRNFSDFFKQKFAQVTNPPIDPIREKVVMSLNSGFGETRNILNDDAQHAKRLKTTTPILSAENLEIIKDFGDINNPKYEKYYKAKTYSTIFASNLKASLYALAQEIIKDVQEGGVRTIILDDRTLNEEKIMPMLMVVGYVNQQLLEHKVRHLATIVAITGEVYDSHSAASLIAFGSAAIYPYMLYKSVASIVRKQSKVGELSIVLKKVRKALGSGLLKVMSKMGISTISSYRNSKLFDIIGLDKELVNECFKGVRVLLSGLGYEDIEERINAIHAQAYSKDNAQRIYPLNIGGYYKYLEGGEYHDYAPATVHAIHAVAKSGKQEDFDRLKLLINQRDKKFIRDFFNLKSDRTSIDIEEVEPLEAIYKRFVTAAMSLGSISPEAHECLAEAMNRLGGMSNSGEGGEDEARFKTIKNSKIKQVASGRFGVTPAYLRNAQELQIKVAQGAKPGEGGQLPGHKVTQLIGRLRHTIPGVTLISPPPHHDIYSIEDLAQLIFDLKQVNPEAAIAVKLVSTAGVGTIAAGVAKAYADKIIISGADGGTGAAPVGSIKFAGNPWELGLIEAHNALKANNLRGQVHLQTDGGLKTGLDVIKAALLGAESYGFGTAALTVLGCKILRICHLNRCTVGIATQEERLREDHYEGSVERVMNYFTLLAEDVRTILAHLGYSKIEDIVGRSDLLEVIDDEFAKKFEFANLLYRLEGVDTQQVASNEPYDKNEFEKDVLNEAMSAIKHPTDPIVIRRDISNLNRSFGARISGEIAKYYGDKGLPDGTIDIRLAGITGQSFGAFLINGVSLHVKGAGNDYIGKGMSGGRIVITSDTRGGEAFSLGGNTCLYGATGGKLYINGQVGERFAVRNSGAIAVVEGTGDHPCEYMTGGVIVILGKTGVNFGAGMTGGVAFVLDEDHGFIEDINPELIEARRIDTDDMDNERYYLKKLLKDYHKETNSSKAKELLDNFRVGVRDFWLVRPKDMKVPLNFEDGE